MITTFIYNATKIFEKEIENYVADAEYLKWIGIFQRYCEKNEKSRGRI